MKTTVVVLMLVAVTYPQEICRKEKQRTLYYVHRANIRIPTYSCFHNPEQDSPCGNNAEVKVKSREILRHCISEAANLPGKKFQSIFCELPAHLDLLYGTVKFGDNITCPYEEGYCHNKNLSKNIFWMKKYTCENLVIIHRNNFTVWTFRQNETKFIKNEHVSLLLTKKIKLCGVEMWKTDYEGIVVSENIATMLKIQNDQKLNSILPKECDITIQNKQFPTKPPKVWFVYKYPTNVTVYFCVATPKNSCEGANFDEITPENNSHLLSRCGSSFGMSQELDVVVCKKNMKIDFEKDQVTGLSSNCKHSEGVCSSNKTFWSPMDRCGALQKVYEGYEGLCGNAKCVIQKNSSTKFALIREGKLCGEHMWYSDQEGFLASTSSLPNLESGFGTLQVLGIKEYFILIILSISGLWSVFKVGICVAYLCTKYKKRQMPKKPVVDDGVELRRM
ncbi:uncharacterized protein LOC108916321 isoform X4 [Anoplophora glabripennis]|uniref:uncharacterized protein LOC108916321 isoform X4 n=1 Tax=Anoplophora glabripennis TaxID=217634 RepID=UPI000874E2D4|nr:uncharacterized protein LOC108916321 isoform X4 [Anoplophora glabripennis]